MKIQILPEEPPSSTPHPPRRTWRGFFKWMAVCIVLQAALHFGIGVAGWRDFHLGLALGNGVGMGLGTYFWFKVI